MTIEKEKTRKADPETGIKYLNFLRNWAHQALTYMDKGELLFRCMIEGLEILFLCWLLNFFLNIFYATITSLFIIHTFNWFTNGLFWALTIFAIPGLTNPGEAKTVQYLNDMVDRIQRYECITGIALYGSVSRNKWHDRSDLDVRVLRREGLVCWFLSGLLIMRERFLGFLAKQPLDMFLADSIVFLEKMREDERPVFLLKRDDRLEEKYPHNYSTTLVSLGKKD